MVERTWFQAVAQELLLEEAELGALIESTFPGQGNVPAADVIAAGAYAQQAVLFRRPSYAESAEGSVEPRGFWLWHPSRQSAAPPSVLRDRGEPTPDGPSPG